MGECENLSEQHTDEVMPAQDMVCVLSGRPGSNRRPPPWQGGVLPLNYYRLVIRSILYI